MGSKGAAARGRRGRRGSRQREIWRCGQRVFDHLRRLRHAPGAEASGVTCIPGTAGGTGAVHVGYRGRRAKRGVAVAIGRLLKQQNRIGVDGIRSRRGGSGQPAREAEGQPFIRNVVPVAAVVEVADPEIAVDKVPDLRVGLVQDCEVGIVSLRVSTDDALGVWRTSNSGTITTTSTAPCAGFDNGLGI